MEPSGRFRERASDGREFELGRIIAWDPPHRLALDFYLGSSPAQPTSVEVKFAPESEGTRITVEHRAKPESADLWPLRAPVYEKFWDAVLNALAHR